MPLMHRSLALLCLLALASPALAQNSGNFVVRLGNDTTGVEHFTRSANQVVIDQVGRAPRVIQRHFVFDLDANGVTKKVSATNSIPGSPPGAPVLQQVDVTFTPDSALVEIRRDTSVLRQHLAVPAGTIVLSNTSPWAMYEAQTMKLARGKADSLRAGLWLIGAPNPGWITVRRKGRDSMSITTDHDAYVARVDKSGRLLNVRPIRGTQKFSADRVDAMDVPAVAASYLAREKAAGTMGALSPRDTVRATIGGATLMIDYGRPSKRGRTVYGSVVPWGEVWRTGANAATQIRTDKALVIGGTEVPAGFYTLWTVPSPGGWKLIVNSETGQWGTAHKAENDLFTIPMKVSALPEPSERFTISVAPSDQGGVLNLDWDTTRASVPFTVKQ